MKRRALETRLRTALRSVIVDEWSLFVPWVGSRPVSELAVCSQLARYLAPQLPRTWDVDCEYNRARETEIKLGSDGKRHPADLIVHRRTGRGKDHNLLIVELKVTAASGNSGGTKESLEDLAQKYSYRHGVYLQLGCTNGDEGRQLSPQWRWFGDESFDYGPVFTEPTLEAILKEAKREWDIRRQRLGA